MREYSFTHTFADGTKRTYNITAESLSAALTIYRQKVKDRAPE